MPDASIRKPKKLLRRAKKFVGISEKLRATKFKFRAM